MANQPEDIEVRLSDSLRLDDDDLIRLRTSSEDHFVERKSFGDWRKDALKTMVAFANSIPIGQPAFLFIGVKDDGQVEDAGNNGANSLDSIQKKLADLMKQVYPPINYTPKGMYDGVRQYLLVIVYGSESRPHFSGRSYVREGSQTKEASESHFADLLTQRQSKARHLLGWKSKTVTLEFRARRSSGKEFSPVNLIDCNQFYVTLQEDPGHDHTHSR